MTHKPETLLRQMFDSAVNVASPKLSVGQHLPDRPNGRTIIVGAGKAAAAMAQAVETEWRELGEAGELGGLVITRYGHRLETRWVEVVEAAHPVPDGAGVAAAARILELVSNLGPEDLVLCLLSGGGSALLTLPIDGVSLDEKRAVTQDLLNCGATISEINTIRKHLSAIKGGRLAAAAFPAQTVTLAISDVPGDDPAIIASGPTTPDPSMLADANYVIEKYAIQLPTAAKAVLASGANETPKAGDPLLERASVRIIVTPQEALEAAAKVAREAGVTPIILSDSIEGESRDVAQVHAAIARQIAERGQPWVAPCVLLSGGETTVTINGNGSGGPNSEFLLSLMLCLNGASKIYALACDTDGIDGSEENAGAIIGPDTLAKSLARDMEPAKFLANNDAYTFFSAVDGLIITGPTHTNVNDFRAVFITK
ncbi:MAG: glycerate kinase [Pseudomonadota bacterium]|nr:glycerate kinase [Pseudomonadota bacterium]